MEKCVACGNLHQEFLFAAKSVQQCAMARSKVPSSL